MKKFVLFVLLIFTCSSCFANTDYNNRIYSIGDKRVEYDLNGRIRKIGDEYVTYYKGYGVEIPKSKVFNPTQSDNYETDPDFELILGAFEGPVFRESIFGGQKIAKIGDKEIDYYFWSGRLKKVGDDKITRNKKKQIISIGDKLITRDENGLVIKIGDDIVHRYKNGFISAVGKKKYFRNQDGSIFYIGDVKYTQDKNGYVNSINSRVVRYNNDYSKAVAIENDYGKHIFFNYIVKDITNPKVYRY